MFENLKGLISWYFWFRDYFFCVIYINIEFWLMWVWYKLIVIYIILEMVLVGYGFWLKDKYRVIYKLIIEYGVDLGLEV